jgi:hypothetical protein
MNRSILIVICDFLLVSLLAFSTPDMTKVASPQAERELKPQTGTNQVDSSRDLSAALRLALEQQHREREQLVAKLNERETQLQTREQESLRLLQQIQTREQESTRLQQQIVAREQESARLQQSQTNLMLQYIAAQTNIQHLSAELQNTATESVLSKEKLAAMEAEMRKQAEQAAALQQQLANLAVSNQAAMNERVVLASALKVAEVEKQAASEKAALMLDAVKVERAEKEKLTESVKALATHSGELVQAVRDSQPLTSNTIFNDFSTNRIEAHFSAYRSTLLGIDSSRRRNIDTVLIGNGTNTYALCHVQDTPLVLWSPGIEWEALTGTLTHNAAQFPIHSVMFSLRDPRIVLMPVSASEAHQLGSKIYRVVADPYKFQDAVVIGTRENYYGECRFQIDPTTPGYVKLDHNFLKGVFGKFNPSSGDLVFNRNGDLLGVMANSSYCMMIEDFYSAATLKFGSDVRAQHTGNTLSLMYSMLTELPSKLQ